MSEKLSPNIERSEEAEIPRSAEVRDHKESAPIEHKQERQREQIETIKHRAEAEAKSSKETTVDKDAPEVHHHLVTKELKDETLKRSLQRTRKQLPIADKALSKAIHQPAVDLISKIGEKTIARPIGILAGAIVALLGSSYVLYSAKHYGFNYNYWIIFILFVGGYLVGLVIELLIRGFRRLTSRG